MRDDDWRRFLRETRVALDDLHATAEDMLRPPRKRELGPALHRIHVEEAYTKATALLDHLLRDAGGAPPTGDGPAVH